MFKSDLLKYFIIDDAIKLADMIAKYKSGINEIACFINENYEQELYTFSHKEDIVSIPLLEYKSVEEFEQTIIGLFKFAGKKQTFKTIKECVNCIEKHHLMVGDILISEKLLLLNNDNNFNFVKYNLQKKAIILSDNGAYFIVAHTNNKYGIIINTRAVSILK